MKRGYIAVFILSLFIVVFAFSSPSPLVDLSFFEGNETLFLDVELQGEFEVFNLSVFSNETLILFTQYYEPVYELGNYSEVFASLVVVDNQSQYIWVNLSYNSSLGESVTEPVAEEPSDEPVEESIEEDSAEEPVDTQEPVEESIEEDSAEEPVDTQEPVEESIEEDSAEEPVDTQEPVDYPLEEESTDESVEEPVEEEQLVMGIMDVGVMGGGEPESYFVSVWDTSLISDGSSGGLQVRLPLTSSGVYNFTVDWGNGVVEHITHWEDAIHTYASPGVYTITINGTIDGFRFNNGGDRLKLLEISSFGTLRLGNAGSYFSGTTNLNITATDILNTT
ncbi:MAG: hypothetical protein ACMXYF_03810, partial [Candidatus Woesearchaeota archaeon]